MQTTLRIDDQVFRQAKSEAARRGVTLTRFIEEALQAHIVESASFVRQRQAEVAERDRLMEGLLQATAHFRVGERPAREELHER